MIDLAPHHLETVKRILAEHLPGCEVRAFGSRATWTAWEYSDLDLAVISPEPLAWDSRSRLREAFEESDLPIRVDVVDWESLTDGFRQTIDGDCVVLQERYTGGDEWETRPLYDLADYINGRATKPAEVEDAGIPVIKIAELHGGISAKTNRVPDDHVQDKHWVRDGDLLFAWSGSVGIHVYRGPDAALNQHIFRVVARPGIDQEYLRYLLLSEMRTFESFVSDKKTTMGHVTIRDLKATYVRIPPLHEQRRIAHILGTLDDKIELNRRMSQTLEAMAQALFKSWFVDFDPVQAKAEGRPTNLPPEIDALFPDTFQDSELGEISSGWSGGTLGDICHKPQYGYTQSAQSEPVGPKFLRITDINKQPWIEWESVPHCEITPQDTEKYRLHHGDILIARMADPGHGCMIEGNPDAVFASYLIRFRPKHERYARYLQYWLRSANYWELVRGRRTGTTRANLNAKALSGFPLVMPPAPVLEEFATQVDELRTRVVANVAESNGLSVLRETLLSALLDPGE